MTGAHHRDNLETPVELRGIDAAVSRLAEADAAAAPPGLVDGVFAATRGTITSARTAPMARPARRAVVVRDEPAASVWTVLARVFTPVRAAAAVSVFAGVVALRMAGLGPTVPPLAIGGASSALDGDIDSMLIASDLLDDGLGDIGQRIDLLYADLVSFDAGLGSVIGSDTGDWLEGGAM